jgi:hypothetical protein
MLGRFPLTDYGMGAGDPEALRADSFWFYRRLGFRPTSAEVEPLANARAGGVERLPRLAGPPIRS